MVWNYSTLFISEEDYKRASFPKKCLLGFAVCYVGVAGVIKLQHAKNPEVFYKRILFTPLTPIMAIAPLFAIYQYVRVQNRVYQGIYERTVGHLSDREILELETKLNPRKALFYNRILENTDKKDKASV